MDRTTSQWPSVLVEPRVVLYGLYRYKRATCEAKHVPGTLQQRQRFIRAFSVHHPQVGTVFFIDADLKEHTAHVAIESIQPSFEPKKYPEQIGYAIGSWKKLVIQSLSLELMSRI